MSRRSSTKLGANEESVVVGETDTRATICTFRTCASHGEYEGVLQQFL